MKMHYSTLNILFMCLYLTVKDVQSTLRGLNPHNRQHYTLGTEFKCLDASKSIPFNHVNDDYCDCSDGSDEPGTAACPNGVFYCLNQGYQPTILPSNRVQDSVCDCCDGSDEYQGDVECPNTCMELGQQLRADEEKKYAMFLAGNELYKQYCEEGTSAKQEHKDKLVRLESEKEQLEVEKEGQDAVVKGLEAPETAAKDKFKEAWEVSRKERKEEREKKKALQLFERLDLNSDGRVSVEELQQKQELDSDGDGEVSLQEAKEHMAQEGEEEGGSVDLARFYEGLYAALKEKFQEVAPQKTPEDDSLRPPSEEDDEEDRKEEEEEEEEEEDDIDADNEDDDQASEEHPHEDGKKKKDEEEEEEQMPPYDEDTQRFIDVAEEARAVSRQLDEKLNGVKNEIEHASKIVENDYGPDNEFYPLSSQCMELSDREYLYKLCPFDRTTQRNKNGGSETNLGRWTGWKDSGYKTMYFEHGQGCWNGPDRSTKVTIECGPENKLLSTEETSRCEYHFVLSTPAACSTPPPHHTTPHQEL